MLILKKGDKDEDIKEEKLGKNLEICIYKQNKKKGEKKMWIRMKDLHSFLEEKIPGFEDAELYFETSEDLVCIDEQVLETQIAEGYVSIDNSQGHEIYYCNLQKKGEKL